MLTQLATVLFAVIAASILFQVVTAARVATRAARRRCAAQPVARVRRFRHREYRLALRAAKASVYGKS